MIYKKVVIPEPKYKSHRSENCFGRTYDQESIKEGLGRSLGNRNYVVKKLQKSKNKWKRELRSLKKQDKILYSTAKRSRICRDMKKTKKIYTKAPNQKYSSNRSISSSDFGYSLFNRQRVSSHPSEIKEMNKLDIIMTYDINKEIQCDEAI